MPFPEGGSQTVNWPFMGAGWWENLRQQGVGRGAGVVAEDRHRGRGRTANRAGGGMEQEDLELEFGPLI